MTVAPDRRSLRNEIVRLDRLVASNIEPLYDAIANEQVYASGFGGGLAGLPASADEMVFSILADEWPEVRKRLEDRIS